MKKVLAAQLMVLVGTYLAVGYAKAQTLNQQIVGVWTVVSAGTEVGGEEVDLFGPNPVEQFTFTPDGHFSLRILRPGRSKLAANKGTAGTPETNKNSGYIAEFGTYTIDSDGSRTLHLVGSEGTQEIRLAQITGDEMTWRDSTPSAESDDIVIVLRRTN